MSLALLCACWASGAAPAQVRPLPAEAARLQADIATAAGDTQRRCQGLIHHDTYAFERCVLERVATEARPTAARLGMEYFGYVGAMNSARMGMQGALDSAVVFLKRFRKTQARLRLDDRALCQTVPGDCDIRNAQLRALEADAATHRPRPRDPSVEQQAAH